MRIKRFLFVMLLILPFAWVSVFSMQSFLDPNLLQVVQEVQLNIKEASSNPTVVQLQDDLSNLLVKISDNHEELQQFLLIMNKRVKLMQGMFFESCARNASVVDDLVKDEFSACLSLRSLLIDQNLDLYTQAEIAYSEACSAVQQAIDTLEVLANNSQLAAYKHKSATIKDLFSYQNIRRFFASRFLKKERPDAYRKFLFNSECFQEIEQIMMLYSMFLEADYYKIHLKFVYDQVYKCYAHSADGVVNPEILPTIFALDEATSFSAPTDARVRLCDFLRLVRLCKVKDFLVVEKNKYRQDKAIKDVKKRILAGEIAKLQTFKVSENDFSQEQCCALIPQLFHNFHPQAQQELSMLAQADRNYAGIQPCALTALKAYFDDIVGMMYSEGLPYSFKLDSDLFCSYKERILDGPACYRFMDEIQQTLNALFPPVQVPKQISVGKKSKKKKQKRKPVPQSKPKKIIEVLDEPEAAFFSNQSSSSSSSLHSQDNLDIDSNEISEALTIQFDSLSVEDKPVMSCLPPHLQMRIPGLGEIEQEAQEEVEQIAHKQDEIFCEDERLICLLDCQRAEQGGYQIEVFVYKNNQQQSINPLENLDYSVLSKITNPRDNNHAFTKLVEVYGSYGRFESIEELPEEDLEYRNGYRFKCFISLPGRLASLGYPIERASERGPSGTFEFIVLKKNKQDKGGICVHRFFRPNK
ncbi:hypothetical protein JST56_04470 [Candidatus Dependentiae bacterium]|jgi:hypothetical protein|nr:hypothetical protein [Candidatus Dependentiae bacterium]